jgi:hypothetical protein
MAETIGSLIDKTCIAELKIYHLREQAERVDLPIPLRELSRNRLGVMTQQRDDLVGELQALVAAWSKGLWAPKVYRQFKLYNDPRFQASANRPPSSAKS